MNKITKCIIPAAWFGTRFLPATKAQPKEMLPIVDKPVIQYLVEEAVSAWITDIVIITWRGKRSIEDHFDMSFELEHTLVEKGKTKELREVEKVSSMANIAYVRQPIPRWDWDALLRAAHLIGNEPFLVLFWDDLIKWEKSWAQQLIDAFHRKWAPVIALEKVTDEKVSSYGILESKTNEGKIHLASKIMEKPNAADTKSRLWIIWKYVLTPEIFDYLRKQPSDSWEIRLADAFVLMMQDKDIYGVEMEWVRYDTWDKLGFLKATIDFALDRDDLWKDLMDFIKTKVI
ncbi:MAG: hypothetical protein ACD_3C00142G0006 [uncultured bacterium (gcode 4)]|uniref:UTP--glucose-1-phosphate uridylyltransferase n=1 Tax=uncultured bacterium (gcode 4) TaxID=1234023 RepID=K2GWV3_9BACT|nr:MAG: hypothetical protein ACD_3C00142G0006 [uncultured bacterium (gcode 4)]